jgi:gliding motility-associated-like protein
MPNAYTPDQDGLNDGFRPVMDSKREIAKFQMSIFNRDGEKIYESEDMNQAWYGNSNDSNFYVKDGVYIWKIKVWLNGDVEPKEYSGNVIIVR